jgi:hypothetical protein
MSKYVTLSAARFASIGVGDTGQELTLEVRGAVGEAVTVLMKKPSHLGLEEQVLAEVALEVGPGGTASATVRQ